MQFPGWWVFGVGDAVWVLPTDFDDTELTAESDWTEAHQNGDPDFSGDGFTYQVPEAVLNNICDRILKKNPRFKEGDLVDEYADAAIKITSLEDLASFVGQLNLRSRWKEHLAAMEDNVSTADKGEDADIPFDAQ